MSYERFAEVLALRGKRPSDIAKETGLTYSLFSDWKSGKSNPKREKVVRIAKALNCNPDYIDDLSDDMRPNVPSGYYIDVESLNLAQELLNNPDYKVLFDASKKLSPESMKLVISLVERLSE